MPLELISYQALCVVHRYLQNAFYRWNACSGGSGLLDRRSLRYCAQVAGLGWLPICCKYERGGADAGRAATTLGPAACP
jgi:hypothetical protein